MGMSNSKFEIIVNIDGVDHYVDTFDNVPVPLNYQISDINDIATRRSSYSLSISLPETANNRYIFNSISDLSVDLTTFNPNLKAPTVILSDSIPVFRGNLQLKSVDMDLDSNECKYSVVVYSENDDFFKSLGDSLLSDLDFTELNHIWGTPSIIDSWSQNYTNGYYYPLINTNGFSNISQINGSFLGTASSLSGDVVDVYSTTSILDFRPATYARYILDKIFSTVDYSYNSEFLSSDIFNNLIVPFSSKQLTQDPDFIETLKFSVGKTSSQIVSTYSNNSNYPSDPPTDLNTVNIYYSFGLYGQSVVTFDDVTSPYDNSNGLWNVSSSKYTQPVTISDQMFNIKLDVNYYDIGASSSAVIAGVGALNTDVTVDTSIIVVRSQDVSGVTFSGWGTTPTLAELLAFDRIPFNGDKLFYSIRHDAPQALNTGSGVNSGFRNVISSTVDPTSNNDILVNVSTDVYTAALDNSPQSGNAKYHRLRTGEEVRVFILSFGTIWGLSLNSTPSPLNLPIFPSWNKLTVNSGSSFRNLVSTNTIPSQSINYNTCLPANVKCKDFLTSIIKMFNLYIEPSKDYPNVLNIEPRDRFYELGTVIDWSDKVDIMSPISTQILAETQNKSTLFTYKDDSDYYNTDYKSKLKRTYGDQRYIIDNDFLSGEKKIDVIFSPTPIAPVNGTDNKMIIPNIFKLNNGKSQKLDAFNHRILFRSPTGNIGLSQSAYWRLEGVTQSSYPYVGQFYPDPYNPTDDLNFGQSYLWYSNVPTNNNLFEAYWRNTMDEISDINSRIVRLKINLNSYDISTFTFTNTIFLKIGTSEGYYRVNKITGYDPSESKSVDVELLKIVTGLPVISGTVDPTSESIVLSTADTLVEVSNVTTGNFGGVIKGYDNVVTGILNNVSGDNNIVNGANNVVASNQSIVSGDNNIDYSQASSLMVGNNNNNTGKNIYVLGDNNIAKGNKNLIVGDNNTSTNLLNSSFVFGNDNTFSDAFLTSSATFSVSSNNNVSIFGNGNTISDGVSNTAVFGVGNTVSTSTNFIAGSNNVISSTYSNVYILGDGVVASTSSIVYLNLPVALGPSGSLPISNLGTSNTIAYFDSGGVLNSVYTIDDSNGNSLAGGTAPINTNWSELSWSSNQSSPNDNKYGTLLYFINGSPWSTISGSVEIFIDGSSSRFTLDDPAVYSVTLYAAFAYYGSLGVLSYSSVYTPLTFLIDNQVLSGGAISIDPTPPGGVSSFTYNNLAAVADSAYGQIMQHDITISISGGQLIIETHQKSYSVIGSFNASIKLDFVKVVGV